MMSARAKRLTITLMGAGAVLALVVLWFGPFVFTRPLLWLLANPHWLLAALALLVASVALGKAPGQPPAQAAESADEESGEAVKVAPKLTDGERKAQKVAQRIAGWAGAFAVVVLLFGVFLLPYFQATTYARSYERSDSVPSYQDRAPFVVADQLSNRDLDDIIGDRVGVHAVQSAEQPNQYTTLVIRRGLFEGYEAVQVIRPPVVGAAGENSQACRFAPEHKLRLDGAVPWNNLERALSFKRPFVFWDDSDAYGICHHETAAVVVPLKRWGGTWPVMVAKPAGVAVYMNGEVTVHDADEVPAELAGPTYPRSIAAKQREASLATGSFADWIFNRAGYDTAGDTATDDEEATDENEPNRANAIDFALVDTDGEGQFVTALTPVGASESVVAAGHVSFRQTSRELNPYVVSEYTPALPALSTSENRIRSDFNHLPGWASGMRVMEITPSKDGAYVASVGQNQVVTYRMLIAPDGSVSLLDVGDETPAPEGESQALEGKDLASMSNEEIVAEIQRLTEELAERAKNE